MIDKTTTARLVIPESVMFRRCETCIILQVLLSKRRRFQTGSSCSRFTSNRLARTIDRVEPRPSKISINLCRCVRDHNIVANQQFQWGDGGESLETESYIVDWSSKYKLQ
jgi:hypothetical protein